MWSKYTRLDVVPGGEPQKFYISENDDRSRELLFRLFASSGDFVMPDSGVTVTLEGRKPDGTDLRVTGSRINQALTFLLPASAADQPGEIPCNVVISGGNKRLYTEMFILVVDPDTREEE